MAAMMNTESESQHFLACITYGKVVMRMYTYTKKNRDTLMASSKYRLMVTMCRTCDETDKIRKMNAFDDKGMIMHINRRMIETWYVYMALTKLVGESIKVNDYGNGTI